MSASLVALAAALVPLFIWLWKRRVLRQEDLYEQHQARREAIAREIVERDEAAANGSLDDDLERLRALQSDQRRTHDSSAQGG